MSLKYINNNGEEIVIAGRGSKGLDGIPEGATILYDGDDIPEGYEEVLLPVGAVPSKITVLRNIFDSGDMSLPSNWQLYNLADSLDNYDALLTQFYYTDTTATSGYFLYTSSFDYIQHTTATITGTIGNWDTTTEYNIQTLGYRIYHDKDTTHKSVQIQHCNSITISPNGCSVKASRMGVSRIIGYKF